MDWYCKGLLSGCTVAILLLAVRKLGRRVAGVLAGMPLISAPALVSISWSVGHDAGASAAVGSIAASAMLAAFALGYERSARRTGPAMSLLVGSSCAASVAALSKWLVGVVASGLSLPSLACMTALLAVLACLGVLLALPRASTSGGSALSSRVQIVATATVAGVVGAGVTLLLPLLGAFASGLVASMPIISGTIIVFEHKTGDRPSLVSFLRGYVAALPSKALFSAVFAALLIECTLLASLLGATAVCLVAAVVMTWALQRVDPAGNAHTAVESMPLNTASRCAQPSIPATSCCGSGTCLTCGPEFQPPSRASTGRPISSPVIGRCYCGSWSSSRRHTRLGIDGD